MSITTIKTIAAIVLIIHGIGHIWGILPVFGVKATSSHSERSPLLSDRVGSPVTGIIEVLLFAAGFISFIVAGLSLAGWMFGGIPWGSLSVIGAIVSIIGLVLYPHAFPMIFPNYIGAMVVNVGAVVFVWMGLFD